MAGSYIRIPTGQHINPDRIISVTSVEEALPGRGSFTITMDGPTPSVRVEGPIAEVKRIHLRITGNDDDVTASISPDVLSGFKI